MHQPVVHLDGRLLPLDQARISPLDRGFLFGDGVYEGLRSIALPHHQPPRPDRRIIAAERHIQRMRDGLALARIDWDPAPLESMSNALTTANGLHDAFVYWQVTRGAPGPGDPLRSRFPASDRPPTVFGYCSPQPPLASFDAPPTKSVITCQDRRWLHGHIKSTSLMGNILAALAAQDSGADEAIFIRDGLIAEGLATNVVLALPPSGSMIDPPTLVTPSLNSASILPGVTRALLLHARPDIIERPIHAEELPLASEILLIGTTTMVTSVVRLDGKPVGDAAPGPVARSLLRSLLSIIHDGRDMDSQPLNR